MSTRKLLDAAYATSAYAAVFSLALMTTLIVLETLGRIMGYSIPSADDFVKWLLAASVFLPLAAAQRTGALIRVEIIISRIPLPRRRFVDRVLLAFAALVSFMIFLSFSKTMIDNYNFGAMSQGQIKVAMWIPQIAVALGLAFLTLAFLDELFQPRLDLAAEGF